MFGFRLSETTTVILLEIRHSDEFYDLVQKNLERLALWCPWLGRVATPEATREFLGEKIARFADGNGFTAGIFVGGHLSGVIALEYIDWPNLATEIGYWIDSDVEGKGIVTSACRALLEHAFCELKLERVQIRCASENLRSRAVPEKLGFTQEGILRGCERLRDRSVDIVVYGLLRREWRVLEPQHT